jgi:hypothetical protein
VFLGDVIDGISAAGIAATPAASSAFIRARANFVFLHIFCAAYCISIFKSYFFYFQFQRKYFN